MAGINNEALETLQQENKTLHKKARQMERRLAETDRLLSLMTTTAKNASQTLAFMEQEILQREKYLNMLLDNCKDFFILLNEKLEITYCSRNFTEVMRQRGFTKLRNQSYVDLLKCFVGTQHKQRSLERLEKLRSGKTVSETVEEIDFRGDGKPGKYTTFAASMYDDANHDFSGILICYSDVTDLVEAREAAEESVKAKAAFLARMSHEIRTPMNAIIGLSKLALRDELPPKARAYCGDVNSAANNLLGIINDILDFSKIESGKMEIVNAEYQFASLVNDVTTIIRMRLSDSAVNFVTDIARDIPGRLFGDEVRIRQILLNLLSNAVKYTREGEIRFSMKAEFGEAGKVTLITDITDTGIGIKEEDLGKLFGNFTRFDMEKNKHVEGTGLGLAITLNLCRAMGGDINVLSEYGKGSTFTAIIPQRAEDFTPFTAIIDGGTGGVSEEDMIHFTAPAARILIVDDIETNLTVAEGLVSPYDVRVDTTLSGTEAISLMQQYEYDIVFMDHMMPEMDGLEATAIIRALDEPRFREVPIIALTANAMSGMREMFLEQGFNDYLSKPIEIPKLDEIMSRWIPREKQIKNRGEIKQESINCEAEIAIPGVDTAKGIAMTGGTVAGYRKVLAQFRKDARERLTLLQEPPEPDTLPSFVTQVHAIKSAAGTIGAAEVSAEAAVLEAAGKSGDTAAIAEGLPQFYKQLSELIETIGGAMKNEQEIMNNEENVDNSLFTTNCASLESALETRDMKEIDRLLEELEKMPLDGKTREAINAVSDKVLLGEYAGAVEAIHTLYSGNSETK